MRPVGELRFPGGAGVGCGVARQREPGGECETEDESGPQERGTVGQPGEEEKCGDECEAKRHCDERRAEARARNRREIAVEQPTERELQCILRAEHEGRDPDIQRRNDSGSGDQEEARFRSGRQLLSKHEQTKAETSDDEGEREEVEPAHEVFAASGPRRAERISRRGRANAHAEREDARHDVPVTGECVPADGVRPLGQLWQRGFEDAAGAPHTCDADASRRGIQVDRSRHCLDVLVEAEGKGRRRRAQALSESG